MNWGHGIAIFFACFVAFMLFLVVKSHQQNIDLVTENYYEQELKYQQQIDKVQNTKDLKEGVKVSHSKGSIAIHFPKMAESISGNVQIFRPSDARFDMESTLSPDVEGRQQIATTELPAGYYRIKINWKAGAKEYYTEEAIHLRN